ncbi:hypothetical protein PFTANZ_06249 [Plasmodium falciparum Tanzania (2000708)]|uniref:Uncharacterized protein n=1 Tax=Plasmodium falciparum Tanzania (2000708) TaxID=1036725 RepID=A0A024VX51_PLAFA|nr:hypothetical protein PFTANZ_06249 [Plasmodium falciparum Tanzania (2000708)]
MAPDSGGDGGTKDESAKNLLDSIGKIVYDEVKNGDAKTYKQALTGQLSLATLLGVESAGTTDTCDLVQEYYKHPNGGNSKRYPCTELSGINVKRFSNKIGGQCTNEKMRSGGIGACAPYRRLHLCHHNLETINNTTSTPTNKLLAEVCMAAKYEGDSIKTDYTPHQLTNEVTSSQLCTELARSFADIGDIVRGKDLFYGNPQESTQRDKLEQKLKDIFKQIHEGLSESAKERYKKDKDPDKNYYQLREDWWTANRHTVWEAITCAAKVEDTYFRQTCGDEQNKSTLASNKCRCPKTSDGKADDQVPTYFDYVPQYLRWFEEWAEDFCRLRKHKLKDAIDKCRRPKGKEKYCDLNRHDCVETIRGNHVFVEDDDCIGCHYSCFDFVKWIDNQKLEFLKQKEKYEKEIKKYTNGESRGNGGRQKRSASKKDYKGYVKQFYEKFEDEYGNVETFLEKLNKEGICGSKPTVGNETADHVDFTTKKIDKTFDHTKYCEACPWCGVKEQKGEGGKWKAEGDETCGQAVTPEKKEEVKVCDIVGGILTKDNLKEACKQKYSGNNSRLGWKCIPTSGVVTATRGSEPTGKSGSDSSSSGAICVPPRRRRLYVGKLHDWANSVETLHGGESLKTSGGEKTPSDKLRDAFIQTAAIETR